MNHAELRENIKQTKQRIEELEQDIEKSEVENNMSGTTKTQKDCNIELIGLWRNEIQVMKKREGYLLALMEQPEQKEEKNLYDAITSPTFNAILRIMP
ncbi:hypothetical protein PDK35_28320 [Bacillus cereus group sp. TH153LC]|uniref:hypothetical protein n=1 Tax=Bacillus cereus group sp. TH153LC TaxID=3018059 RepID=UPI0022E2F078|nr:hypothetical protein [Bacillus cereus group sp. TH153LC]MDA1663804.1 hypothetical protein [Bacillus cereus group sp. TH153LC]